MPFSFFAESHTAEVPRCANASRRCWTPKPPRSLSRSCRPFTRLLVSPSDPASLWSVLLTWAGLVRPRSRQGRRDAMSQHRAIGGVKDFNTVVLINKVCVI